MKRVIVTLFLLFLFPDFILLSEQIPGKQTYENYCSSCHSLEPPPKAAPPFRGIYMHYSAEYKERKAFAQAIRKFVHSADSSPSLMPQAQERFGKMPALPLKKEEIEELGYWIWDHFND